jgi:hypothetical protein
MLYLFGAVRTIGPVLSIQWRMGPIRRCILTVLVVKLDVDLLEVIGANVVQFP